MIQKKPRGIVLILVVLAIAAVFGVASTFASIIIQEIKMARLVDQSVQASYAAESGAERALYQVRRRQAIKGQDCYLAFSNSICSNNNGFCSNTSNGVACINSDSTGLGSDIKNGWQINVANEQETSIYLNRNDGIQLDLFNPYLGNTSSTVEAFSVQKQDDSANSVAYTAYGELTNLSWLIVPAGPVECPNGPPRNPSVSRGIIQSSASTLTIFQGLQDTNNHYNVTINPSCSYVLRFNNNWQTPTAGKFIISVYRNISGSWQKIDIPSRLVIDSQATFGNSFQKIKVRTSMRQPLSGLYDYVIFSEEQIVKKYD